VVALTEATPESVSVLGPELGMQFVLAPASSAFARDHGLHVAWLSRLPIRRTVDHRLPALSKTLLEIEVEGVRLFATHLASRHEEAVHPRREEVRAILAVLAGCAGPHLLAGDLNALPSGEPIGTPPPGVLPRGDALPDAPRDVLVPFAEAGYVDCYRALHGEPGYTYPADAPWLRLDYVFASAELAARLRGAGVVTGMEAARASDHLPVWAEFALIRSHPL
jgi:endonuclease/exonuclease/phosphatase family metal-dependent hydrolase